MKKTFLAVCTVFALTNAGAQNVQEGINHLYADRFKSAEQTFQKILAVNPNVIEATYWLGQTYLDRDDNDAARQLYDKALAANGNAPLIMVGKGHVLLLDKKIDEARQMFESALTVSRTKKGDDPAVLNAIGRANVDAKDGNLNYAVEKLELALQRDPKNADVALNLGNAYRKKDPGQGGGKAYENYKLASQLSPNFAYPYVRIAALFETQKQWDLVLENLNKAIQVDPTFSLAYYELFYYYFFAKQDYAQAEATLNKYIGTRPNEDKAEDDYMYSQLCWAKKDWNCAITKAESVKTAMGAKVKPRAFKQLAYSYLGKGDLASARTNIDEFFKRTKDAPLPADYELKANIYQGGGASCEEIYALYLQGAAADTVIQNKVDFMTKAADFFKTKKCTKQEADMRLAIYNARPNANPTYLVNIGILYSQAGELLKADTIFANYIGLAPDSIYGYYWRGRISYMLDTTMSVEPYVTNLLRSNEKTIMLAVNDKDRLKSLGTSAALMLTGYWNNVKGNRDTAYVYLLKGLDIDSTNMQLKNIKEIFDRQPPAKGQKPPAKTGGNKLSASIRKPGDKG